MKRHDAIPVSLVSWALRALFAIFCVLPIYASIIVALTPYADIMHPQLVPLFWHFINFRDAMLFIFPRLMNSFFYSIASVAVALLIAVPSAYVLARYRFRGRRVALFSLLLSQMMAGIVIMPSLYSIFNRLGFLNTRYGLILVLTGVNLALVVWILFGFFQSLPKEVEEAAMIDGASFLAMLVRVVVPVSGPGIAVGAIFVFINTYNEFVIPLFLITDSKLFTITLSLYTLLTDTTIRWHIMAASSLIGMVFPILIFVMFQKYIVKGLTSGALKG